MFKTCFFTTDYCKRKYINEVSKIQNLFTDKESKDFGINTFEFDESDVVRSELVKFLVTKFKDVTTVS